VNSEAKQEIKEGRDSQLWQISKPSGKRKARKNFTVFVKTPNGTREKTTLKGATGMVRLRGSAR
jgi:hypothetical protein